MGNMFQAIGAGLATGAAGFLVGGPIGGLAGFGIGMASASQGMRGKSGAGMGALIGGLAGFAVGGPVGALAGGLLGGLGGKIVGDAFKPKHRPPRHAPHYPPMMGGGYGMMGGMGMGMPMGGMMGGMGMGMPMGGMMGGMGMMGMNMGMGGMSMGMMMQSPGMFGGFGCCMGRGMYGGSQMGQMGYGRSMQGGQLQQKGAGKPITYNTSGGYKVNVNGHTVTITDPSGKNTVKHWGDPHENVNGKTIKDWEGKTRSLVLGDGTKITMNADSPQGVIKNMSIYDQNQAINIDNNKNQVTGVSFNPMQSAMQEAYQPDGETSYVGYNNKGNFIYRNIYTQDKNLGVTSNNKLLAKSHDTFWRGHHTHDYYNDPRLFWT